MFYTKAERHFLDFTKLHPSNLKLNSMALDEKMRFKWKLELIRLLGDVEDTACIFFQSLVHTCGIAVPHGHYPACCSFLQQVAAVTASDYSAPGQKKQTFNRTLHLLQSLLSSSGACFFKSWFSNTTKILSTVCELIIPYIKMGLIEWLSHVWRL